MRIFAMLLLGILVSNVSAIPPQTKTDASTSWSFGISNPAAKLQVQGVESDFGLRGSGSTSDSYIFTYTPSGASYGAIGVWNGAGSGSNKLELQPTGNVGIGISNPSQKLDVAGNIRITGNIVSPNDICIGNC